MNVISGRTTQDAVAIAPRRSLAQVAPVRELRDPGERTVPQSRPPVSREQQEDVIDRLDRTAGQDPRLPLRGRRAIAAYNALSQAEEQAYMKQVLGFEVEI